MQALTTQNSIFKRKVALISTLGTCFWKCPQFTYHDKSMKSYPRKLWIVISKLVNDCSKSVISGKAEIYGYFPKGNHTFFSTYKCKYA